MSSPCRKERKESEVQKALQDPPDPPLHTHQENQGPGARRGHQDRLENQDKTASLVIQRKMELRERLDLRDSPAFLEIRVPKVTRAILVWASRDHLDLPDRQGHSSIRTASPAPDQAMWIWTATQS